MWPALLAGMGAGLLKSELVDKPQANRERELAATTASLSPWTGLTPSMPQEANPFGSMLQGGLAGLQFGQGLGSLGVPPSTAPTAAPANAAEAAASPMVPKMGGSVASPWRAMGYNIA
jgi:hypothetical protein